MPPKTTVKILHVSNFGRKAKGAFLHGVGWKISNGLIRNGHFVANFSDRDVARAGSLLGHRKFGVQAANRALRDFCRDMEPDILLLGHADVIRSETISDIRSDLPSLRVAQWNVDAVFVPDNVRRIKSKTAVVDATLVSTAGQALAPLARRGMLLGFLPNPVDFSVETGRNHEREDLPWDLFYACGNERDVRNVCGRDWLPAEIVRRVSETMPELRVFAPGLNGTPNMTGARYQRALEQSAVGLNLSRRNDFYLYTSDRAAQMAGNGVAVVMDRATGYDRLIGEDGFAFFSTLDEMAEKVAKLKGDISYRQALAAKGRERYHALFNERIVARYVVDAAFGDVRESDYAWPTVQSCDAAA